jgi:hypothetical protein
LEHLDFFNIIHGQKQFAECSSPESIKTPGNNETITITMSKEELQEKIDEVVVNTFVGCLLGLAAVAIVHYFFFE